MKRNAVCALVLAFVASVQAYAQLGLNISIRTPTPAELSAWQRDRSIITVTITNGTQTAFRDVRLSFTIRNTDDGRTLARTRNDDPAMPRFSVAPFATAVLAGADVVNVAAVEVDDAIRTTSTTTNRLPEANYEFCARLIDNAGNELGTIGEVCRPFLILIPDPPTLLLPEDGAPLAATGFPMFQWTPVPATPGTPPVVYRLKIAPVFATQLPRDAIERNTPLFNRTMITNAYTYLPSDPLFSSQPSATSFAWQVEAMTSTGAPAARNEGKSEIFTVRREGDLRILMAYPGEGDRIPDEYPPLVVDFAGDRTGTWGISLVIQELNASSRAVVREAARFTASASLPAGGPIVLLNSPPGGLMNRPLLSTTRWAAAAGKFYLWTVEFTGPGGRVIRNSASFSTNPVAVALGPASGVDVATATTPFFFRFTRPSMAPSYAPGFEPGPALPLMARVILTNTDLSPREVFRDSVMLPFTIAEVLERTVPMPTLANGPYRWRVETVCRNEVIATSEQAEFVVRGTAPCTNPCACVEPAFPPQNYGSLHASDTDQMFSLSFRPRINNTAIRNGTIRVWYRQRTPDGAFNTEGDLATRARTPDFELLFTGADMTEAGSTELFGIYNVTPHTRAGLGLHLRDTTHYLWDVNVEYDSLRIRYDGVQCRVGRTQDGPFFFSTTLPGGPPLAPGECADECSAPAPTNTTPATRSFAARDTIHVGKFHMVLTRASGTGAALSGEGTIAVPFLRAPIQVEFTGIQVNALQQVFNGTINGKQATGSPLPADLANRAGTAIGLTNEQIQNVQNYASDPLRLVSAFTMTDPVGLPLGFDRVIEGKRLVIGVIGMRFTATIAQLNAVASITLPELGPDVGIGLGARDICFHPGGLGGDGKGKLYLPVDFGANNDTTRIGFLVKAPTPADSGTYVTWDCHGWKEVRLRIETEFPRAWMTPAPDNGRRAAASFTFTARNDSGWMAVANMDRVRFANTGGLEMEVLDMTVDLSSRLNPPGILFPTGFSGERSNAWTGFYIRRAMMNLPETIRESDGSTIQFSVNNVLIGNGGVTFSARAENLVRGFSADIGGMGATIDTLALDLVSSSAVRGWMTGLFKLPFSDSSLTYRAMMGIDSAGRDFALQFNMVARDTINFTLAESMSMYLARNSRFDLHWVPNQGDAGLELNINLGGAFFWSGSSGGIAGINFRGIQFENFVFRKHGSETHVDPPQWHFASEQHSTAGFPVSITAMNLVTGTRPRGFGLGLQIGLSLNIQPGSNTISGSTLISGWGVFTSAGNLEFDGVELDSVGLRADLGAVIIEGGLRLYRTDPVFGDGFRGNLSANFLKQVIVEATMQAGNVRGLRYWYVDAKAALATGIPIFSGVGIYGFGGGAWYHMRREGSDPVVTTTSSSSASSATTTGSTRSGYRFVPDEETEFGFRAMVILGTHPKPDAFNADVGFEMTFIRGGGIGIIAITGDGYMLAGVTDRSSAKVVANVRLEYNFPEETFHGTFDVRINADPFTGGGHIVMHADPHTWYFKIGEPMPISSRVNLNLANWLVINTYFMVGKDLPAPPPLPDYVLRELPGYRQYRNPELTTGDGFAFGASARFDTGKQTFLIFYGQLLVEIGFDFSLLNYGTASTCSGTGTAIGLNGWYAQGQMYAYISASIGLHIDLAFFQEDVEILSLTVAAALEAGAPNPTWIKGAVGGRYSVLNGAITGQCTFQFQMGEECRPVLESPISRIDLISDLQPMDGSTNVDVFVQPEAAFNFTIDRPFDIVQRDEVDGRETVRTFRVRLREFTLAETATRASVPGRWRLMPDSTQAEYQPTNMLGGRKQYTARVTAYGEEYATGRWAPARRKDGGAIDQTVTSTFTTGAAPDTIPADQVAYSYPINRQRFFLQDECRQGLVVLNSGMAPIFDAPQGYNASIIARFVPTFGGSEVEVNATYDASSHTVEFLVPQLMHASVYALQIVKKLTAIPGARTALSLSPSDTRVGSAVTSRSMSTAIALRELVASSAGTAVLRERKLLGMQVRQGEKLLYVYWFRTSQFKRLADKVASLRATGTEVSPPLGVFQFLTATYTGPELFDQYDVEGYVSGTGMTIGPLVHVSASNRSDRWHTTFVNPWIYEPIQRLRGMGQWTGAVQFERYQLGWPRLELAEFLSYPLSPLMDNERGPMPPSLSQTVGAISRGGLTGTPGGLTGLGGLSTASPAIRIRYDQGVPIGFDYAALRSRAASLLGFPSGPPLPEATRTWLRGIVNKSYELFTRGNYTLDFRYGYYGCQDPDAPMPTTPVRFTY